MFRCVNLDCVFSRNGSCVIPKERNMNITDNTGQFHCVNYITDIKEVDTEVVEMYFNLW